MTYSILILNKLPEVSFYDFKKSFVCYFLVQIGEIKTNYILFGNKTNYYKYLLI